MQAGYGGSCQKRKVVPRQGTSILGFLPLALGLLAFLYASRVQTAPSLTAPRTPVAQPAATVHPRELDLRTIRLANFFTRLHCPISNLAGEFVQAADANSLDWRLLPGISMVESSGGKLYRNNNIFGWRNGEEQFSSVRSSIREVAFKLGRSPLYRRFDSVGKLRLYNPNEEYAKSVLRVMYRISPVVNLRAARTPSSAASGMAGRS